MFKELELLSQYHDKWCAMVANFGCNEAYIEDIVQEAYIKVYERLECGLNIDYGEDDINQFYFYMVLRSIYVNQLRKKGIEYQEYTTQDDLNISLRSLKAEYEDVEMEYAYERLIKKIFSEVNTWDFYNRNIFISYFTTSLSLNKLSKGTDIGRASLYNSVRKYREIIQEKFGEDAQDYFNGDFNLIK